MGSTPAAVSFPVSGIDGENRDAVMPPVRPIHKLAGWMHLHLGSVARAAEVGAAGSKSSGSRSAIRLWESYANAVTVLAISLIT